MLIQLVTAIFIKMLSGVMFQKCTPEILAPSQLVKSQRVVMVFYKSLLVDSMIFFLLSLEEKQAATIMTLDIHSKIHFVLNQPQTAELYFELLN